MKRWEDNTRKYLRLYKIFFKTNLIKALAYPGNFWFMFVLTGAESLVVLFAVNILFNHVESIAGWSYHDMLVLIGVFMLSHSLAWIFFKAGINDLDMIIQKGDLDWYLIKPADTQFLVTIHRIDVEDAGRSVVGVWLIIVGLQEAPLFTTLLHIPLFVVMMLLGQVVLYAVILAVKIVSFKSIQGWATNAISWRFHEIAHYPTDIYRGMVKFIYTFIFPLIFIATVPAKVLTGKIELQIILGAFLAATISLLVVRILWKRALKTYSSASS